MPPHERAFRGHDERAVAKRPNTHLRRHEISASQTISRLSGPLLKHGS
jgi:hypothetical protein